MSRTHCFALALSLTVMASGFAHADDETNWSSGLASIYIGYATPTINLSVENVSDSTDPSQRDLRMTSPQPEYSLSGQVFCKAILGGTTRLLRSQLLFGTVLVNSTNGGGTMLWPTGVWDASDPIVYEGSQTAADVDFQHQMDIPTTWEGNLVTLGFNPVKVVEDELAQYVDNGGTAADFLRQDDVFEAQIAVNLAGVCQNSSDYGVAEYAGYTRRSITVAIFYKGDPDIEDPIVPIVDLPGTVEVNPDLPEPLEVHAPFAPILISTDDGDRAVSYDRFSIYDPATESYLGLWSGWVSYDDATCYEQPVTAVTPDGECVLIEGCVPAEFDGCRAVPGCCDAPFPAEEDGATR